MGLKRGFDSASIIREIWPPSVERLFCDSPAGNCPTPSSACVNSVLRTDNFVGMSNEPPPNTQRVLQREEERELARLLDAPREHLNIEIKGWLNLEDEMGRANLAKAILALAN